jgi:hypothetical protein
VILVVSAVVIVVLFMLYASVFTIFAVACVQGRCVMLRASATLARQVSEAACGSSTALRQYLNATPDVRRKAKGYRGAVTHFESGAVESLYCECGIADRAWSIKWWMSCDDWYLSVGISHAYCLPHNLFDNLTFCYDRIKMITIIQINANVPWQYSRAKGGNYVAVCDPLKLTLQAPTFSELMEDIAVSLDALMKDLLSENELDKFLRERGWSAVGQVPTRPRNIRFDVPFAVTAMRAHGQQNSVHQ